MLRHIIRHRLIRVYYLFAVFTSVTLVVAIFNVSTLYGVLYLGLILFVTLLSPLILIYAYQYKNDIRGPWDCP
jgi:hypothetical protein